MRIVLLGAPGAGKGTQAVRISKFLDIPHISTGDIFRANIREQTELGKEVQKCLADGHLVPDNITIAMVADRVSQPDCVMGYILDGFPRTVAQALSLDTFSAPTCALNIDVNLDLLTDRLIGRRVCPHCNACFHISTHLSSACVCGTPLIHRNDDHLDTVKNRLNVYSQQTTPLIEFYRTQQKLLTVDGNGEIDEITEAIKKTLGAL